MPNGPVEHAVACGYPLDHEGGVWTVARHDDVADADGILLGKR
jgi:hypothetical protein